ncbi:glycosyltransferase family 4 protein [Fictibacillus nanhaiensis]|uniref:glycosyltransferase family 4 protein n=1 Tax=Fictibacillus nanhaiensis TaxID=742169 RepID=UPI001C93B69C|nr:glycosyltransferase family 4 protein [Fictibacillus nanhaiensis]MBY6037221.1 glycosyltransferase family 4 protein [Fictibacillus nanhaiensis]
MNVLLVTDKLTTGGAEVYFCKLENALNHENITTFTAAGEGELYDQLRDKKRHILLSKRNVFYNLRIIYNMIRHNQIQLVHANSLRAVLLLILLKIITLQHFTIFYTKHNVTLLEKKLPFVFSFLINTWVKRVITVSDFEKDNLIALGIHENKITTIYNGVDLEQFLYQEKQPSTRFKVGILARLSEEKNHSLFLDVAHAFKDNSRFLFYIAGDGPDYQKVLQKIRFLGLQERVQLLGNVEHPELFIRDMDVLLLTSKREVFPMVVIEAMAVGTPIITINKGGIPEAVIHKQTGLLMQEHSIEEFCSTLVELDSKAELQKVIIKEARRKVVTDFSLDKMIKETTNEYLKYG